MCWDFFRKNKETDSIFNYTDLSEMNTNEYDEYYTISASTPIPIPSTNNNKNISNIYKSDKFKTHRQYYTVCDSNGVTNVLGSERLQKTSSNSEASDLTSVDFTKVKSTFVTKDNKQIKVTRCKQRWIEILKNKSTCKLCEKEGTLKKNEKLFCSQCRNFYGIEEECLR